MVPKLGVSEEGVRPLIETFLVVSVNSQIPIMTDVLITDVNIPTE